MRRPILLAALPLALAACSTAPAPEPAPEPSAPAAPTDDVFDAESLIAAMFERYAGEWYQTLSFTQRTTMYRPDTTVVETWREYGGIPGRLRIEMGPEEEERGVIFARDSAFAVQGGRVVGRRADRNPLMILGFDVYRQPTTTTLAQLIEEGVDFNVFRTDTWEGRPVYVVGAAAGDERSPQFWVDAERLLFVRLLQPAPQDPSVVTDIRFEEYRPAGGGWIAPRVDILQNGRRVMLEEYSDVQVDVPLDPVLWDPDRWLQAP